MEFMVQEKTLVIFSVSQIRAYEIATMKVARNGEQFTFELV